MIAKYLRQFPIIKEALIGNLQDGLRPKDYLKVIIGLNQEVLEGILGNLPHATTMRYIKEACTDEECKLVDAHEEWFKAFRKVMIEFNRSQEEEEETEAATEEVKG